MSENIKLTPKQRAVIIDLKKGTKYFFNAVTNYHPYTVDNYGSNAKMINGQIMNKLETMQLVEKKKVNLAIYEYFLTEKAINLNLK